MELALKARGWYVWEAEYPEEGYVGFNKERPTAADLRAICESYVEVIP